ncbi:MAG: ribonuclease J [Bacilli bacterium]|nr:ribonuclease J [Bacilli bacterium]
MSKINFFALGGLGENGKNLYVLEILKEESDEVNDIFIFDAGLKYPTDELFGVDTLLPNITYIIEHKDKVKAIFLSHGHEEQIGGVLEILKVVSVGVFGSHFTISVLEDMIIEAGLNLADYRLYRINEEKELKFGEISVNFYNVAHSIPEAMHVAVRTADGLIVYAPDFTFDVNTNSKYRTSISKICDLGKDEVLAVMAESIGSANINRVNNDVVLDRVINDILKSSNRVIFTAYSEELSRIQKIIDLSVAYGRRVAIIGIKAQKIVNKGIETGYLQIPPSKLVSLRYIDPLKGNFNNDKDLVVIVTGNRHKPFYMIQRMCRHQDRLIEIGADDHIVIASPTRQGNEIIAAKTVDEVYKIGAKYTNITKDIMRSSHADSEDLNMLYSILKPKYIIPIEGEARHLMIHKKICVDHGFNEDNIIILENGEVVSFIDGVKVNNPNRIKTGDVLVDGSVVGDISKKVLKDRELMAEEGLALINIAINKEDNVIRSLPDVVLKGVIPSNIQSELIDKIIDVVMNELQLQIRRHKYVDYDYFTEVLVASVAHEIKLMTKKNPKVIINFVDCIK